MTEELNIDTLRSLYDDLRTSLMNRMYYGHKLAKSKNYNIAIEILIAIGTSGAIGGWIIWQKSIGVYIWAVVPRIVAILAILKPIINLTKQIELYSSLFVGHGDVYYDLKKIVEKIKVDKNMSDNIVNDYLKVIDRIQSLAAKDNEAPDKKLLIKFQNKVNVQLPSDRFWLPERRE
jgi:hypothetical protein